MQNQTTVLLWLVIKPDMFALKNIMLIYPNKRLSFHETDNIPTSFDRTISAFFFVVKFHTSHRRDWKFLGGGKGLKSQNNLEESRKLSWDFRKGKEGLRENPFNGAGGKEGGMDSLWNYTSTLKLIEKVHIVILNSKNNDKKRDVLI